MNFRTIYDLNIAITRNLLQIKKLNIDLIVGIPRSGLLPASLIATHLQLPFTDVEGYINNRYYDRAGKQTVAKDLSSVPKRVLLVDDSINSGKAMSKVLDILPKNNDIIIKFAVFGSPKNKPGSVDMTCEIVDLPRAFQWNIWKHDGLAKWGTDMDGVLCRDPSKKEVKREFENFVLKAETLYNLKKPIKYIITARKEQWRSQTEQWLKNNNVPYRHLIMKTNDYKHGDNVNAEYKVETINRLGDLELYIESNDIQAQQIAKQVSIPVWCTDSQKVYKCIK